MFTFSPGLGRCKQVGKHVFIASCINVVHVYLQPHNKNHNFILFFPPVGYIAIFE